VLECENRILGESGWISTHHVQVRRFAMLGVQRSDCARDVKSPVSTLRHVFIVAQGKHQLVACFGVLSEGESACLDGGGEAIIREGWGDNTVAS